MKKILILSSLTMLLFGCNQQIKEPIDKNVRFSGIDGRITIVTDNETGCKYIREVFGQGVSLSVLLKSDGTPDCEN